MWLYGRQYCCYSNVNGKTDTIAYITHFPGNLDEFRECRPLLPLYNLNK